MLSRRILISTPFSSITVSAAWAEAGLTASSSSTLESLARLRPDLAKYPEPGRPWLSEQPVPRQRAERHDAGEPRRRLAKSVGPQQHREAAAQPAHRRLVLGAGIYRRHQEDRRAGQRCRHWLRHGG